MLLCVSGVNYNVNNNYTKYLAQQYSAADFYVLENFHRKLYEVVRTNFSADFWTFRIATSFYHQKRQ